MIAQAEPAAAHVNPVEELQQTVSATRLNTWLGCRLKFFFRYVLQLKKAPTPSMHAGVTAHALLQHWNMGRWRRQPFQLAQFKQVFADHWQDQPQAINWDGGEDQDRDATWRALEHYFAETPIKADERPEAVEVRVDADLSKHGLPTLVGVLDLVRAGGVIVDFKLVGKTPDLEQVVHATEVQLTGYSILYRDATGRLESSRELHHLVRTKAPKCIITSLAPATEAQKTRLFRQIESYQKGIEREDFVPSPGFGCTGCEFINECRQWQ
jgi:putative RecB family exonuclease